MTEPVNLDELDRWEALLLSEYKAAEEEDREGYLENWDEWRVVYTAGEEIRHLRAEVKRLRSELADARFALLVYTGGRDCFDMTDEQKACCTRALRAAKAAGGERG